MASKTELMPNYVKIGSGDVPRWTIRGAAVAFDVVSETLRGKLIAANERPDSDDTFSTRQILTALYSDIHGERLRRTRAEANSLELKTAILAREYLNRRNLFPALGSIIIESGRIIDSSPLSAETKAELRQQLSTIPVILEQHAEAQNGTLAAGELANPVKRKGRPRKVLSDDE